MQEGSRDGANTELFLRDDSEDPARLSREKRKFCRGQLVTFSELAFASFKHLRLTTSSPGSTSG